MGYLGYNREKKTAFIPNAEIKDEIWHAFSRYSIRETEISEKVFESILDGTLSGDEKNVASQIEKIHEEFNDSPKEYNDEDTLASVLIWAYLKARDYYLDPRREFKCGKGFADLVYIPKPEYIRPECPALFIELRWDKTALSGIGEIKAKNYPESIKEYTNNILLVDINYDKETKTHECIIEKL